MSSNAETADFGDKWPPGFRFHPTDEELVVYYLKRKICDRKLKLDVIREIDVYKWDPEELPGLSILKTGDRQWFFFSPRDRKYPNGSRSNRATRHGYWKATGKDRTVTCNSRNVGIKKTLVFYKGRAPSGERTDWVMHEYILEESELIKCEDVQSYYVLYKVFKKSGPGPKNGEQYGALFREEDWNDNEVTELGNYTESADVPKEEPLVQWDDIEEFMKQLVDEPELENHMEDFQCAVPQVFGKEGAQSSMTETSYGKAGDFDLCNILPSYSQQIVGGTLDVALPEAYDLTSTGVTNLEHHVSEEDFLEMNDLLGQEITNDVVGVMPQPDSSQWGEVGGLSELDFYYDSEMFLRELGSVGQVTAGEMVNLNQEEAVPFSAAGDECGGNENENGKGVEGDDKWYTSGLWSFVESIPTTPASAAESALVNRAFERMSSFTRLRLNLRSTPSAIAAEAEINRSTGGSMKRFFVLSLIGALLAILFVFCGGYGRIMKPREYV